MTILQFDAVIVGAGIVGGTLAGLLIKGGRKIAVVEPRLPEPFEPESDFELRVSAISRASQRALVEVSAWERVLAKRAHAYEAMQVWDAGGSGEIRFDSSEMGEADLGHIVENNVIQSSLLEVLAKNTHVTLFTPSKVVSMSNTESGGRLITLDTGEQLSANLIVGADGSQSVIRDLAGLSVMREDYGQKGLVTVVKTEQAHQNTAWQRFLSGGPLAFLPLDNGYSSIVWTLPADRADRHLKQSEDEFKRVLAEALDYRLGAITDIGPRAAFPLMGSQASAYIATGVALVGDSAHTIHPLAGQGVNLGIKDAVALAELLSPLSSREWGSHKRLRQYERARKGDDVLTMKVMEGFKTLFGHDADVVKLARNTGLNIFNSIPLLKQQIMRSAMGL
ncbi:UbiH/UbiF/VisC/COQ6 family ubiquinone biosynthesis hydroxylase [Leucothrix pacifica]|uniref:2-octaprenyl-3-methyl-6-methoxy-1,4-benzoquinol hydroxylase n=1 Tax=Leucothrix pacifica TaxID=1247513 RepID=A0A317CNI6_9GAMM|nr:UbiH/UbiF/VisC/COQ6 family ubiquinone biosynthesis hydroxylase [Leucothrix pacifica]PWR00085.1 2-octaprenyl-3-methyl-6-methoxy-1,4-benzoquinol hydroxylase [Leucothrix pacifica]